MTFHFFIIKRLNNYVQKNRTKKSKNLKDAKVKVERRLMKEKEGEGKVDRRAQGAVRPRGEGGGRVQAAGGCSGGAG